MALASTDTSNSGLSDWLLELSIGIVVVVLGLAVWGYTHFSKQDGRQDRPKPAWLAVSKVMTQMGDGRMVNVKINLRLADKRDIDELEPHLPAFKALIQEAGTHMSQEDLQQVGGVKRFGDTIRSTLNDYLEEQHVPERVKDVAFEEMLLMP